MTSINALLDNFYDLKIERAKIAREIDDLENLICSITERIDELKGHSEKARSSKDWRDQFAKARDKRRGVRDTVADKKQEMRRIEARIETLALQIEYGELEEGGA
jgi:predicted  nucleic acid-binding Zn-ribbon protein